MTGIINKLLIIMVLAFSVAAWATPVGVDCNLSAVAPTETERVDCENKNDIQTTLSGKALYAGDSESVIIFRVKDQGTSVVGVVTVVVLVPGLAVLFGSWLAKSSK